MDYVKIKMDIDNSKMVRVIGSSIGDIRTEGQHKHGHGGNNSVR